MHSKWHVGRHKIICNDENATGLRQQNRHYILVVVIAMKMAENSYDENRFLYVCSWNFKGIFKKDFCCRECYLLVYYCVTCAHVSSPESVALKQLCKLSSSINSPSWLPYTHIHTHQSPPLSHSHSCSDSICLAQCAKAGFKIFPPPVQICSTLKWISLFHLSPGLTGKWIILTGPVWSLFNLSPWFWVFLEQGGGVSHCWHFAALM